MLRVAEPLRELGAAVDTATNGTAPVHVRGGRLLHGGHIRMPVASAQLASSLMLAATGANGSVRISGAGSARDHTAKMLPHFGVAVRRDGDDIIVDGPQRFRAADFRVPGDPSAAAFWLAAAAIVPGARIAVENVNLNPTRLGFVDALATHGRRREDHGHVRGTRTDGPHRGAARSRCTGSRSKSPRSRRSSTSCRCSASSPRYAAGTTVVRGARELRVKESDRIAVLVNGLRALGGTVTEADDGFDVTGGTALRGATVASGGDHRLAMAFAIAALGASAPVTIEDSGCVAISHPSFFADLGALCRG